MTEFDEPVHLNGNPLYLDPEATDASRGLRWSGSLPGGFPGAPDGPVVFGYNGGALATDRGADARTVALTWDAAQNVSVAGGLTVGGDLGVLGDLRVSGDVYWKGDHGFNSHIEFGQTQIAWGRGSFSESPVDFHVAFPAAFYAAPAVTVCIDDPGHDGTVLRAGAGARDLRPDGFVFTYRSDSSSGRWIVYGWIAIGIRGRG
jgi:hypothetical protein